MKPTIYEFEVTTSFESAAVDRDAGVIRGVSVITGNVRAKGHNLEVDDTTLGQMLSRAEAKGQVPVKWNHQSGADAVNGYLTNFRKEGKKLRADWHLLKTHDKYEHALELAERMPTGVGMSTSFSGLSELADGTKVYPPNDTVKVPHIKKAGVAVPVPAGAKVFARCDELVSVDLVATPAANPDGMFGARSVDKAGDDMAKPSSADPSATEPQFADLMARFDAFASGINQRFDAIETRFSALEEEDDGADDEDEEGLDDEEDDDEYEGAAGAGANGEFSNLGQVLHYFESRIAAAESQESQNAYEFLEDRVGQLVELSEQLAGENQVLALALKELSAKTKNTVEFSSGAEGGSPQIRVTPAGQVPKTEFEARVNELKAGGLDAGAAMVKAVDEDSDRYQRHLQAKGATLTTL